jgi:hypothetical protein
VTDTPADPATPSIETGATEATKRGAPTTTPGRPLGISGRIRRRVRRAGRTVRENSRARIVGFRERIVSGPLWRLAEGTTGGIRDGVLEAKRRELVRKRAFGASELEALDALLSSSDRVIPIGEAFSLPPGDRPRRLIALRHDTDHDIENAVRFARWEAEHGYRATYYVLHGDWYWSRTATGRPSRLVIEALAEIAALGHEIGLHNNAVSLALRQGGRPEDILGRDLANLRRAGHPTLGTVRHGDPLCHELGYWNSEIFADCPSPGLGPPDRAITWADAPGGRRSVQLAPLPLAAFGLTHEANWIGQDQYQSDTGGRWMHPFEQTAARFKSGGGLLQVLVHPVWWALSGERHVPRPSLPAVPAEASSDGVVKEAPGEPPPAPEGA